MTASTVGGQLAEELQEIRERSGLSLAALASRTPYSKSSWERYLNGKKPVPRQAVDALCALTGTSAGRLLALWELADAEWSGRARPVSAPKEPQVQDRPAPSPVPPTAAARAGVRWWAVAAAVAGVAAACLAVLAFVGGSPDEQARTATEPPVRNHGCRADTCEGKSAVAMGCGAAGMITTLATHTASDGRRLELRHAKLCHAVWVRATGLMPGDRVELSLPAGRTQSVTAEGSLDAGRYLATPMASGDSRTSTRICLDVPDRRPECFTG
ncbi:helix-turn-helix domain-containing protein [Streptomyces sp. BE133]|uniref:helix-turn-helix domain-containing protein n=1 Tax=Streptomyces sp. BE133 TaxID=3002523 RepID=UPI002E786A17|nr:helix-turn-helix domain-containing protein [Streptomyces sp. BE133]MEE1808443.1 helix-turn-helix domain-containing protein [Streptomyces sp. BE133]